MKTREEADEDRAYRFALDFNQFEHPHRQLETLLAEVRRDERERLAAELNSRPDARANVVAIRYLENYVSLQAKGVLK